MYHPFTHLKVKMINGNHYLYRFITYNRQDDYRLDEFPFKSEEDNYLDLMRTILYNQEQVQ